MDAVSNSTYGIEVNDADSAAAAAAEPAVCHCPTLPRAQQMPGEGRRADGEEPDRRRQRVECVRDGGGCAYQLALHRGQGVERRWVVERSVRFDVPQFAHVGGGRLPGLDDELDRIGVPNRIPGARNRLPMGQAADCCEHDERGTQDRAHRDHQGGPDRDRCTPRRGIGRPVQSASDHHLKRCDERDDDEKRQYRGQKIPRDADGAERQDRERHGRRR